MDTGLIHYSIKLYYYYYYYYCCCYLFIYFIGKDPEGCYSLQVFVILRQCLNSCWSDGVYLTSLVHKFWKLTLQVREGGRKGGRREGGREREREGGREGERKGGRGVGEF